jgi:hypothetical protein
MCRSRIIRFSVHPRPTHGEQPKAVRLSGPETPFHSLSETSGVDDAQVAVINDTPEYQVRAASISRLTPSGGRPFVDDVECRDIGRAFYGEHFKAALGRFAP